MSAETKVATFGVLLAVASFAAGSANARDDFTLAHLEQRRQMSCPGFPACFPRARGPYAFVGRVLKLQKPIVDGIGMVTIGGTVWRVAGRDCPAGQRVQVVHAEGTLLVVDPLDK